MYPYQPPPQPAAGGVTRPRPVSLAAALLMVVVFGEIVVAGMNVLILPRVLSMYDQEGIGSEKTVAKGAYIASNVLEVLGLILFVVLGIAVLRGRNWARITTIVVASIGALCCTCTEVSTLGGGFAATSTLQNAGIQSPYPTWYEVGEGVVQAIVVLVLIAVIILLASKPAGQFFAAVKARSLVGHGYTAPGYPRSGPPGYGGYPPGPGY